MRGRVTPWLAALLLVPVSLRAQTTDKGAGKPPLPLASQGDQVVVKRDAVRLLDPDKYRVPLFLEPHLTVTLSAPFDGVVKQVLFKPNSLVKAQSEVVRLENTVQNLTLQKAQAEYRAALIEQKEAEKRSENQQALAAARVEAAKAAVDLAKYLSDQTSIRTPISGEVLRVLVTDGEYVRAGDPLLVIGDTSRMKVEIPVERQQVEKDKPQTIKVESAEVMAKVEAILPLAPRFDPLRDLFESVASAIVVVDNPDGKYKPGQTVYVPLIPRHPVVELPSGAVGNLSDGGRKVQVLRQWIVRDLPVTVMGSVGSSRVFVSGPFAEGDEVIFETSHQLPDGFQLKPAGVASGAGTAAPATGAGAGAAPKTTRPAGGF
uniref:HlyD family efflux transporter periplasmic adaptor subunit n=1 Tax=Schlesneria paludicola TaxID=360056 RepID=A0A7C4LQC0_9PLAN